MVRPGRPAPRARLELQARLAPLGRQALPERQVRRGLLAQPERRAQRGRRAQLVRAVLFGHHSLARRRAVRLAQEISLSIRLLVTSLSIQRPGVLPAISKARQGRPALLALPAHKGQLVLQALKAQLVLLA